MSGEFLESVLSKYFNISKFRDSQKEAISSILDGSDTLVLLPTGGGKSLCYQLPALLLPKMTLVISPLIALMNEQVTKLRERNLAAGYINSSLDFHRYQRALQLVREGRIKILYVAPETLQKRYILELLKEVGVSMVAIDEAHCISQWGHDFRPEYRNLSNLRTFFPEAVFSCFTATATKEAIFDIQGVLGLKEKIVVRGSFFRPNLKLRVVSYVGDELGELLKLISSHEGESGIIYCQSKKKVEEIEKFLQTKSIKVKAYHAGFSSEYRKQCHEDFLNNKIDVVVATVAFGMGIDKEDARFVVHMDMPKTLEQYYQEIGRAGRDGKAAECLLFFRRQDIKKQEYLIKQMQDLTLREVASEKLGAMLEFCRIETCRWNFLAAYFSESQRSTCETCDNCLSPQKN